MKILINPNAGGQALTAGICVNRRDFETPGLLIIQRADLDPKVTFYPAWAHSLRLLCWLRDKGWVMGASARPPSGAHPPEPGGI